MTRIMQHAAAADLSRRVQRLLACFGVPCGTIGRVDRVPRTDPRSPTPAVQRRAGADTDGKRAAPRWAPA